MRFAGMNITFRHFPFNYFLNTIEQIRIENIELWAGEPLLICLSQGKWRIRVKRLSGRSSKI